MATAALSITALALNSAGTDWTAHPLARRILASFATSPAPMVDLPRHQQWGGNRTAYTGFRVDCLRILRTAIVEPAFRAAEARGDADAARALAAAPSVSEAIDDARRIQPLPVVTTGVRHLGCRTVSAFITSLTARPALQDAEVQDALAIELVRERKEADEAMAAAIAAGRRRTYYLSPAIFDPIDKLRDAHDRAARALANTKKAGLVFAIIQAGERQTRVELETAIQLRAIRLTVSHSDPEDYWDQWKHFASSQPIVVNGGAL